MEIRIIGIGQSLRGDDSAGLRAVDLWRQRFPQTASLPSIQVILFELPGLELINLLTEIDICILVDAVRSGAPPGTIHRLDESNLEAFVPGSSSAHGLGVAEALYLARQLYPSELAGKIIVIGIEAGEIELGNTLSLPVLAALDDAVLAIEASVNTLLS